MTSRMGRSKIGYTGIGADGRPVKWYYGWNPGGFGCSGGCEGCWARRMCKRMKCEKCQRFEVHLHPERLCQPANTKKPGVVLVNFTCDTFDMDRPTDHVMAMMDVAIDAPQHAYVFLTKNVRGMVAWGAYADTTARDNWYMGLTIRNQAEADEKLGTFLQIPGNLWLSLEPTQGDIVLAQRGWIGAHLNNYDQWQLNSHPPQHQLKGVVIGHDNRRGAPGTDSLDHIRSLVRQCQVAGVNVFVKQIWHEGRFLRASLPEEFAKFPDDLKLNTLPWSMPNG